MSVQLQVRGTWGGAVGGWRPAVTGTLNQTGSSDAEASTFIDRESAEEMRVQIVSMERAEEALDRGEMQFRIVQACPQCGATPTRPDPFLPLVACLGCGWQRSTP